MNSLKTIKIILCICIFSFVAVSCSKEDEVVSQTQTPTPAIIYPEENFYAIFKTKALFTEANGFADQTADPAAYYENGIVFKPTVKGKINAVNLRLPVTNESGVRVTIWDKATGTAISTVNVIVQAVNFNVKKTLPTPVVLEKDKEYVISFYSKNYYTLTRGSKIDYPITSGNIVVTDFYVGASFNPPTSAAVFPNTTNFDNEFRDGFSFDFQRTE